jgi:hypothetical protein
VGEGPGRVERHETLREWRDRVTRVGFTRVDVARFHDDVTRDLPLAHGFRVRTSDGALELDWEGTPLIAATAWRP